MQALREISARKTVPREKQAEEDRNRLDLSCIEDMVLYFQRVLKGREDKKRKERKEKERKDREKK